MKRSACAVVLVLLGPGAATQRPAAQTAVQADRSFSSSATAILVDVVVRDRKGAPVLDLTAADFELAEDGVGQKVDTFTRVVRGTGIGVGVAWKAPSTLLTTGPRGAGPADDAPAEAPITALVFDHLSAESLRLAQKAALDYVPMSGDSEGEVGVFALGPGVRALQRFTTDRSLVRRAVAQIVPSGSSMAEQQAERRDDLLARRREIEDATQTATAAAARTSGAAAGVAGGEIGQRETTRRLIQTELNLIRSFDNLDRDQQGYDTSRALLSIVESLSYSPGRKTIVFFSDGLPVSPALSARFDSLIEAANRAHVTAYAVDAKGLRTSSSNTAMMKEVTAFVQERTSQLTAASDATNEPLTMGFERVEDTLRLDSRTGLARLAEDTGGFLIEGTNDLGTAFRRIDEDSRFHYLLTYSPSNTNFDGRFRTIGVKVRRPGARVFARRGYRAIRRVPAHDAGSHEAPAIALMDQRPLPRAFPVHAAAFSFPESARPGLTPVVLRFGTAALRFDLDHERSTYSAQAVVVVRIRDGARDVERLTQEYLLTGAAKDVDAARSGEIVFYREPDLPPGVYTVESIVFDARAAAGSVRVGTVTVPGARRAAFDMSSLVLVSRVEEVTDLLDTPGQSSRPFYIGRSLLYPNLGEPIRRAGATELPFYFALYGEVTGATAHAQLLRGGQPLAEAPVELPPAAGSRVQHAGRLPIGALPAGTYEIRIRVTSGTREVSRSAFFTLLD